MELLEITHKNYAEYPAACFCKVDNPGRIAKRQWMKKEKKHGLTVIQAYADQNNSKRVNGFIEFTDGVYAYRAVDARGYLFIHCIWVNPNNEKNKGLGSKLIDYCVSEARKQKKIRHCSRCQPKRLYGCRWYL